MNPKIMVVDDSAMSRRTLRRILEGGGYTVVEAEDGMVALEMYCLEKPAAVLLDLVMKGMYGMEVLAKLRELDQSVRVIVATADIQSSTRLIVEAAGGKTFISKPFSTDQVLEAVRTALESGKPSE